jgi:glycosyltransferase involved in cell wall biosynthesis
VAAGRDQIHLVPAFGEAFAELCRVVEEPASWSALDDRESHADAEPIGGRGPDRGATGACGDILDVNADPGTADAGAPAARIVAVTPGPPFGHDTFSGISPALLGALDRRGALAGAVDARPGYLDLLEKAASVSPDLERWKQRYNAGASPLSLWLRGVRSRLGGRRAAAVAPDANALLQLTGYFNPQRPRPGVLRCSYHDENLAGFTRRRDLLIDTGSRPFQRAVAWERSTYDSIDLIFCMSEALRQSFIHDFEQAPGKVRAVGAGANVAAPGAAPKRTFEPPRLLFVGKRFERKGGPTVVAAFEALRADYPEAELWIVGPTGLQIDRPGVTVYGRISRDDAEGDRKLQGLFARANAFVMPSVYEPLGVAVIEAMGYRLPCIGSTAGAMTELISDGVTGFLVDPGNERALADRMRRLAADPEGARRMGEAGYERYLGEFTWDAVAGRMLSAISVRLRARADGG